MAAPIFVSLCTHCMASCYGYIIIYSDLYIILMLRLYNRTGIYSVKYKQSIVFGNIYIGSHFLALVREKSDERRQNVTQVAVCHLSEHYAVIIWMSTSALSTILLRTRDRSDVILEKRARIVCSVSSYNLCTTAENNRQELCQNLVRALNCLFKVC